MNDEPKASKQPIDVASNVTPITQKKVENVDPSTWDTTPVGDLYDQLSTLQNRYFQALEMDKPAIANQLNAYIEQLKQIIKTRENKKMWKPKDE